MKKLFLALIASRVLFFTIVNCLSVKEYIQHHGVPAITNGYLNLANKNLTSLDGLEDIPSLNLVTNLYLDDNQLQSLPDNIFDNLVQLKWLFLYNNQLQSLPTTIFNNLAQLQGLFLYNNQIRSLPEKIFNNLVHLQALGLSRIQLQSLPATIFNTLTQLQRLSLHDNQLQSVPATIFDTLVQLRELSLHDNQLQSLPATIFNNLAQLKWLDLEKNQIQGTTQQFRERYLIGRANMRFRFKNEDQEKAERVHQKYFDKVINLTTESKKERIALLQELQTLPTKNIFNKALALLRGQKLPEPVNNIVLTRDSNSDTVLHKAILLENPLLVKNLVQRWPQLLMAKNNQGQTPLHKAMTLQNRFLALAITQVLLAATSNPQALLTIQDNNGDTLIQVAISNHQFTVLQFLLTLGYDYKSSKLEHKINTL